MIHSREERAERFKMFHERRVELRRRTAELIGTGGLPLSDWITLLIRDGDNFDKPAVKNFIRNESSKWDGCFMMLGEGKYEAKAPEMYRPVVSGARPGERFEEYVEREVAQKMKCGEVRSICYHGRGCYMAEFCSAARHAGFLTNAEMAQRAEVATEFRW